MVGAAFVPIGVLFNGALFPSGQFPFFFLGFFVFGRSALLLVVVWAILQAVAAIGLLKLEKWGLFTTIALQCLALLNSLLLLIPANRDRFQQIMVTMMNSMNQQLPFPSQQVPFVFPMWISFAAAIPLLLVILWFLLTRRSAFLSEPPARLP